MKPRSFRIVAIALSLSVPSTRAYAMKREGRRARHPHGRSFSTLNSGLRDETVQRSVQGGL